MPLLPQRQQLHTLMLSILPLSLWSALVEQVLCCSRHHQRHLQKLVDLISLASSTSSNHVTLAQQLLGTIAILQEINIRDILEV
jgi:hypothetical protein